MQDLFYPESVVVVGVSDEPSNMAAAIVRNLERFGFKGPVYCAGRTGGELNGRKIHEQIREIDGTVDCAVLLIPARFIPRALDDCGKKGVRYAIIESAGFSEYGEAAKDLERKVLDIAKKWNIRFVGPNGIGIVNLENGFVVPFVPFTPSSVKRGAVSLVSQSGGVVVESKRLLFIENIGFNKMISMGNKLDTNEVDFVRYLVSDPSTHMIGMYLENIADGRGLMRESYRSDKPIIVLKANTNPATHRIAQFHTSALAGDDQIADSSFRQAGLHRVQNMQEMMKAFKVFSLPLMRGKKLGVICRSGGHAVLIADAVHRHGFELAGYSASFYRMVEKKKVTGVIRMTNPLDLGDVYDIDLYIDIIERALQEKGVDGVVFHHAYVIEHDLEPTERLIKKAERLAAHYNKPLLFCMLSKQGDWFSMKQVADFPIFTESDLAIKALKLSYHHFMNRQRFSKEKKDIFAYDRVPTKRVSLSTRYLQPEEAFELLKSYDLPVADYRVVKGMEEGLQAGEEIGYPVVLKVAASDILHKTEAKGVVLDISNKEELAEAFARMGGERFLIQKMTAPGREVIIGGKKDNDFGAVIMAGLGGIFVEVLKDMALRVAPIDREEAERMLDEIKGGRLLEAFRGQPAADKETLVRCVVRVSNLMYEHPEIRNLDINPIIVGTIGEGCTVVDTAIEVDLEP